MSRRRGDVDICNLCHNIARVTEPALCCDGFLKLLIIAYLIIVCGHVMNCLRGLSVTIFDATAHVTAQLAARGVEGKWDPISPGESWPAYKSPSLLFDQVLVVNFVTYTRVYTVFCSTYEDEISLPSLSPLSFPALPSLPLPQSGPLKSSQGSLSSPSGSGQSPAAKQFLLRYGLRRKQFVHGLIYLFSPWSLTQ